MAQVVKIVESKDANYEDKFGNKWFEVYIAGEDTRFLTASRKIGEGLNQEFTVDIEEKTNRNGKRYMSMRLAKQDAPNYQPPSPHTSASTTDDRIMAMNAATNVARLVASGVVDVMVFEAHIKRWFDAAKMVAEGTTLPMPVVSKSLPIKTMKSLDDIPF